MTARLPFTELAVRRAIRAARAEGIQVKGVTVRPDGSVSVFEIDEKVVGIVPGVHRGASSEFEDFKA